MVSRGICIKRMPARRAHLGVKETVEAYNGAVVLLEAGRGGCGRQGAERDISLSTARFAAVPTDGDVIRTRRKLRDDGAIFASVALG